MRTKKGEIEVIRYAQEKADLKLLDQGMEHGEEVIEGIWWMFSTTYARCAAIAGQNDQWVSNFYQMFLEDFLKPFYSRWRMPGSFAKNIDLIFGPVDLKESKTNMRYCTAAAFLYEGTFDQQLVRPYSIPMEKSMEELNSKTGAFE